MVEASCVQCHAADRIGPLLEAVAALPADRFDSTRFPPSDFPLYLRAMVTDDLAEEPYIESGMPTEQAWILHELNELDVLLAEEVPPDFSDQAALDAFVLYSGGGYTEGCELLAKLAQGEIDDPEGMPPAWAPALMEQLGASDFARPGGPERAALRTYVEGVLGAIECPPEEP